MGWKMVYNFLGKDEDTGEISTYFRLINSLWKRSPTFFRTVYPNNNHVTTHPEFGAKSGPT